MSAAEDTKESQKSNVLPYIIFFLVVAVLVVTYFIFIADQTPTTEEGLSLEEKQRIMEEVAAHASPVTLTDEEKNTILQEGRSDNVQLTPQEKAQILSDLQNNDA